MVRCAEFMRRADSTKKDSLWSAMEVFFVSNRGSAAKKDGSPPGSVAVQGHNLCETTSGCPAALVIRAWTMNQSWRAEKVRSSN